MIGEGSRGDSDRPPAGFDNRSVNEDVEEVHYTSFAVVDLDTGELESEFHEGWLSGATEAEGDTSTSIIVITVSGPRVLVAVPEKVWHKKPAKRKMPSLALQKPLLVSVATCSPEERETLLLEGGMKIWVGYITVELAETIDFMGSQDASFSFGEGGVLPMASALGEVATEHFGLQGYNTAESGAPGVMAAELQARRLEAMEEMIKEMRQSIVKLSEEKQVVRTPAPKKRHFLSGAAAAVQQQREEMGGLGGLDDGAVRAATMSGVPPEHLREVSSILKAKPRRLDDLPRPVRAGQVAADPLEQSEEEDLDGLPLDGDGGAEGESGSTLEKALVQLTLIAGKLSEGKQKRDPIDLLLDNGGGAASSGDSSSVPYSRKNAAALRALQKALQDKPKLLYQALEANMQTDYLSRPVGPGEPLNPGLTARGWLASKSRVQNYPVHVRWAWQTAGILDCLMTSRYEEARARAGLLLAAADQAAIDGGSWIIGSVALLESPPPFHLFSTHTAPTNMELQHSALLDPRWVETFLSHIKDVETYQETKKKLGKPSGKGGKEEDDSTASAKAKAAKLKKKEQERRQQDAGGGQA